MAEKDVKKRMQDAMEKLGISAYAIAKSCSINERTIYQQTNGSSKLGIGTLEALLLLSPDLSAEWLLRGNGAMLISQPQHETLARDIRDDNEVIAALNRTIDIQEREIAGLYDRIKELKGAIVMPHCSAETV